MNALFSDEFLTKLKTLAEERAGEYKANKPFAHIYFDNFLPVEAAEAALRDFPQPKELRWNEFANQNERKLAERLGAAEVRLGGTVWSLPNG